MDEIKAKKELKKLILDELYYFLKEDYGLGADVKLYLNRLVGQRKNRILLYKVLNFKKRKLPLEEQERINFLIDWMKLVYKDI